MHYRKKINHSIAFLDVFISAINNQNLTHHFNIRLVSLNVWYRSFKIFNNLKSFHNDIENIKSNLIKNAYPPLLIDSVIKKYLDYKFSSNQNQLKDKFEVHYFKLPYIGNFSHHIKNKRSKLCKAFCKENFNIKLVFN